MKGVTLGGCGICAQAHTHTHTNEGGDTWSGIRGLRGYTHTHTQMKGVTLGAESGGRGVCAPLPRRLAMILFFLYRNTGFGDGGERTRVCAAAPTQRNQGVARKERGGVAEFEPQKPSKKVGPEVILLPTTTTRVRL